MPLSKKPVRPLAQITVRRRKKANIPLAQDAEPGRDAPRTLAVSEADFTAICSDLGKQIGRISAIMTEMREHQISTLNVRGFRAMATHMDRVERMLEHAESDLVAQKNSAQKDRIRYRRGRPS
jgi:hypothetical protein